VDAEVAKNLVAPVIGEANLAAYKAGFNDSKSDQATRISFKYGCARGVTGTPYFFVNGIPLISDSGSPLEYNKWKSILDPLVGKM
jgi:protein-disulfide isomerase